MNASNQFDHQLSQFTGFHGLPLSYRCWHPIQPPKAIVVLIHGLGSHSGLFDNIVQHLQPQGYILYALDLRGHGRSPGKRGYINTWDEFRGDVDCFLTHIAQRETAVLPCFLLGHSLGGLISLEFAIRHSSRLAGVVAIAPALGDVGVPLLKLTVGRMLSRFWPQFSLSTGLGHGCASRDPEVLARYRHDPLRHTQGTARLATEFLDTTDWVQHHANQLNCPLLILHGSDDRVALPQESDRFFQNVTTPHKNRYEYEGGYHDLHNDINVDEILQDLSHWLEQQMSRRLPRPSCLTAR